MRNPALIVLAAAALAAACSPPDRFPSSDELELIRGLYRSSAPPSSPTNKYASVPAAAALGKTLFEDVRLSSCGTLSCASCHPSPNFVVGAALNNGCYGNQTKRNAPTLLNVSFRRWFYWDGQKDSLWSHAILPLTRPDEMASSAAALRIVLQEHYGFAYAGVFGKLPDDEPDDDRLLANFGKAIEAYLRTVIRTDSPFDQELKTFIAAAEEDIAADEDARVRALPNYLGLETFVRKGRCIICHKGASLTDDNFHNLGVTVAEPHDEGRAVGIAKVRADIFNGAGPYSDDPVTGRVKLDRIDQDLPKEGAVGAFKTPSLRNVSLSAPYMHTGKLETLEAVVEFYNVGGDEQGTFAGSRAETLVPLKLTPSEKAALVALLKSLESPAP